MHGFRKQKFILTNILRKCNLQTNEILLELWYKLFRKHVMSQNYVRIMKYKVSNNTEKKM